METPTTPRSTLNPPVFYTSAALILALVLFTVLLQEEAQSLFNHVQQWIITNASWFYVLAVALILISVVFLAVSRYGTSSSAPTTVVPTTATPPGSPCCSPPAWASV